MTDSLSERLDALEARVTLEAGLRASVDRDLAALGQRMNAANHLLQALAITQSEHGEQIARLIEITTAHSAVLEQLVSGFAEYTSVLDQHTAVLDQNTAVLDQNMAALNRIIGMLGGSPEPS